MSRLTIAIIKSMNKKITKRRRRKKWKEEYYFLVKKKSIIDVEEMNFTKDSSIQVKR